MIQFPPAMDWLIQRFAPHFTEPTFERVKVLLIGVILTPGRRTVLNMLWTVRSLVNGHESRNHRVLSRAKWSLWAVGKTLTQAVIAEVGEEVGGEPVGVAMDEHATPHRGKQVYGKAKHRDPVRSSQSHTVWLWGHKWVPPTVFTICVKFPFASRLLGGGLPVMAALYRSAGGTDKLALQLVSGVSVAAGH